MIEYRGYRIYCNPPPIPDRRFDFEYLHEDYDGEGDLRAGSCESVADCKSEIDDRIKEDGE